MGFAYLLSTEAALAAFGTRFNIPQMLMWSSALRGTLRITGSLRWFSSPLCQSLKAALDSPWTLYCLGPLVSTNSDLTSVSLISIE